MPEKIDVNLSYGVQDYCHIEQGRVCQQQPFFVIFVEVPVGRRVSVNLCQVQKKIPDHGLLEDPVFQHADLIIGLAVDRAHDQHWIRGGFLIGILKVQQCQLETVNSLFQPFLWDDRRAW